MDVAEQRADSWFFYNLNILPISCEGRIECRLNA